MGASTEELQKHVKEISERIRKGEYPGFLDAKVVKWVEVSIQYAEAVVAVLLDAVERMERIQPANWVLPASPTAGRRST